MMKGYRTIIFNVITGLLATADQLSGLPFITPEVLLYVTVIGNFILRFMTNTSVGKSIGGGGNTGANG